MARSLVHRDGSNDSLARISRRLEHQHQHQHQHFPTSSRTYYDRVVKEKWPSSSARLPGPSRSLQTDVERRVRGTARGYRLLSSCLPSTETASLTALNCVLNSVVSDDAFFGTIDLTGFYLGTPVTLPLSQRQYIRVDVDTYSPAVLSRLSLYPLIRTGTAGNATSSSASIRPCMV